MSRHDAKKRPRLRLPRALEDVGGRSRLGDASVGQDDDPMRDAAGERQLVRHDDHRLPGRAEPDRFRSRLLSSARQVLARLDSRAHRGF